MYSCTYRGIHEIYITRYMLNYNNNNKAIYQGTTLIFSYVQSLLDRHSLMLRGGLPITPLDHLGCPPEVVTNSVQLDALRVTYSMWDTLDKQLAQPLPCPACNTVHSLQQADEHDSSLMLLRECVKVLKLGDHDWNWQTIFTLLSNLRFKNGFGSLDAVAWDCVFLCRKTSILTDGYGFCSGRLTRVLVQEQGMGIEVCRLHCLF